jgi:hypothetical protein
MRLRAVLTGLIALCAFGRAIADNITTAPSALQPFKVSPETTAAVGPLNADGSVNYVGAINAKFGDGVTPENNGVVVWLKIMGTKAISEKVRDGFVAMSGSTDAPELGWVDWSAVPGVMGGNNNKADAELTYVTSHVWKSAEHPEFAAYLKDREALLALAGEAAQRDRWWSPAVGDGDSVMNVYLPTLGSLRAVCRSMCARALMRAGDGDIDGFAADVLTVKRLVRKLTGWAIIDALVWDVIDREADSAIGAVAGSGALSADQSAKLAKELDSLPPMTPLWQMVDLGERWDSLDFTEAVAMGQVNRLVGPDAGTNRFLHSFEAVDRDSVDWNVVMQKTNAAIDELVQVMKKPTAREQFDAENVFYKKIQRNNRTGSLAKRPGETRDEYTQRIAGRIIGTFFNATKATEKNWARQMSNELSRDVVAAAQFHADNQKWPARLEELTPKYLAMTPVDVFAFDQATPVIYKIRPGGVWMDSVGPDGMNSGGKGDDIAVGAAMNTVGR